MGSGHSKKELFQILDRDNSGVLTLDQILHVQKIPSCDNWSSTHSPLLLFRFDTSQEGSINFEEFRRLVHHLHLADKKAKERKKKETSKKISKSPKITRIRAWTAVDQDTVKTLNLSREETPMITGKVKEAEDVPEEDLSKEELDELLQQEAREFFGNLLKRDESKKKFLTWLFHLADVDHSNTISKEELQLILNALAYDGISAENLAWIENNDQKASDSEIVQQIMEEYDTGSTGFLTYDEFMVLADLIMKNYQVLSDSGETYVGRYHLKRKLGSGSSSVVWLAVDQEKKQKKAVKVIPKGDVADMSRVDVEIQAMLMLKHPNVVGLEEVLETEDSVYFVMELCGGGCMSNYVLVEPLREEVAAYYFIELVKTVKYCHSQGICHRDLKLENLLLDNEGNLKVADFGHAGIFATGWDLFSTGMMGSMWHLSPEQLKGQCYSGEKIDIWALGILLYRLLCGVPPFFSSDANEFINSIMNLDYKFPDHLSKEVQDLIRHLLILNPEERWDLDRILEHSWCKGPTQQPALLTRKIELNPTLSPEDCWSQFKRVLGEQDIHFLEKKPPPMDPAVKFFLRCTIPAKDLKFFVCLRIEENGTVFLEFNLKDGESWRFKRRVDKILPHLHNLEKPPSPTLSPKSSYSTEPLVVIKV